MAVALLVAHPPDGPAPVAADDLPSAFRGPGAVADSAADSVADAADDPVRAPADDPALDPATTPFSVLGGPDTLVLLGGGVDYALLSADGSGEVGRGDVFWRPRGSLDCSPSATPFGATGTDFSIHVESTFPVAGTVEGTVGVPTSDCRRAAGTWRGTGGDLAGREGTLVVSRRDDGLVRVALGP